MNRWRVSARTLVLLVLASSVGAGTVRSAPLPSPDFCTTTVSRGLVQFSWGGVVGAQQYLVYRDGVLIGSPLAPTTQWDDARPLSGLHDYCVQATAPGFDPSAACCSHASDPFPPANPKNVQASNDLFGAIRVSWGDVDGETHFLVSRDDQLVYTTAAHETTFFDSPRWDSHRYCVRAMNDIGPSGPICATGAALDTGAYLRLSWGTCTPQVSQQEFHGPDVYTMVISARGVPFTNSGHDTQVTITPDVPDAWRFDDAGCQTLARLSLKHQALGADCPAMVGTNPLAITDYQVYPGGATLRLAITYDELPTDPQQRYVLWKVGFDHTQSVAGSDSDPSTCDGAEVPLTFAASSQVLLTQTQHNMPVVPETFDAPVRWTGTQPVKTRATTWGRVKSLYR